MALGPRLDGRQSWRVDQLGQSLRDLIAVVNKLRIREIGVRSLSDSIDMATPTGTLAKLKALHCDPTVNVHDRFHGMDGDDLIDIWPIDTREC